MNLDGAFFSTLDYKKTNKSLGKGTFGEVFLVENVKTNEKRAAKIINNGKMFLGEEQKNLVRESSILNQLEHPAIIKFYGINFHSFCDPTINEPIMLEPTILTEFLSKGSLNDMLKKERNSLADADWNATKKHICLIGIADAMRYLHKLGILHRDLKPANILFDDDFYPRVCDFGLSRCFSDELAMTKNIGTPLYMAPELLNDDEGNYGTGVDVYSFAIMAYEIVAGIEPYSKNGKSISMTKLITMVMSGRRPEIVDGITETMSDLLMRCWCQNANERLSFDDIYEKLSTNFTFIDEDVDEDEIKEYIAYLEEEKQNKKIAGSQNYKQKMIKKRQEDERKNYLHIIKELVEKKGDIKSVCNISLGANALHLACKSGSFELVQYIMSLDKFDIESITIFINLLLYNFNTY